MLRTVIIWLAVLVAFLWIRSDPAAAGSEVHSLISGFITFVTRAAQR